MTVRTKASILIAVSVLLPLAMYFVPWPHARILLGLVLAWHYWYFLLRVRTLRPQPAHTETDAALADTKPTDAAPPGAKPTKTKPADATPPDTKPADIERTEAEPADVEAGPRRAGKEAKAE
jgi:hypothetical protein